MLSEGQFKLTAKQEEALSLFQSDAMYCLLYGGSRSTKTFTIIRNMVIRAMVAPGARQAILRFRFNHVKSAVIYDTFPKVMELCWPDCSYNLSKSDWFVKFPNGSEIWFGGLDDKERTEKILGNEYCVDPESMVLMADLTWKRAEDVRKGDEIVSFPENLEGYLKLERASVEFNKLLPDKIRYKVTTDKGGTIVSERHKFVVRHDDSRVRNPRTNSWRSVEDLLPGDKLKFGAAPWVTDKSYDGGWLAGIFDGEGWITIGGQTGVAQNIGTVLSKIKRIFEKRSIIYRTHANQKCNHIVPKGMWASMKAIGSLRPARLMGRAHLLWEGRHGFHDRTGNDIHNAEIISIERLPQGPVRAIQTSSKTLITDGFLSHNCAIFLNECSQISYGSFLILVTRLAQKITYERDGERRELRLRLFCDENPPQKGHWTHRLFIDKKDPDTKGALKHPDNYISLLMNPRDNAENLPQPYLDALEGLPKRQRDRFWLGLFAGINERALWNTDIIEKSKVSGDDLPDMVRVVVSVDPSGATDDENTTNDDIGIVVCGLGTDGNAYVFEDITLKAGPKTWGEVVASAYERHDADRVIGESNYGGAMVEFVIKTANSSIPYKAVTASRGKMLRAEPVSALHESGKIKMVGDFPDLEDEMTSSTTTGYTGVRSPNRLDAFVFAINELFPALTRQKKDKPVPLFVPNLRRAS